MRKIKRALCRFKMKVPCANTSPMSSPRKRGSSYFLSHARSVARIASLTITNTPVIASLRRRRSNPGIFRFIECLCQIILFLSSISLSFLVCTSSPTLAADKSPVPRFVSLKPNEVNARVGPGPNYPVEWIYIKAGLPIEIVAEFDTWRKIRDKDGEEGWVHQSMLSSKRHAIIQGGEAIIYADESTINQPLVRLQEGVVVELQKCQEQACQVRIFDFKGWIPRPYLWGVYPQEKLG
jgi:SH3-like domain-containing protein